MDNDWRRVPASKGVRRHWRLPVGLICLLLIVVASLTIVPRTANAANTLIALDVDPATPGIQTSASYPEGTDPIEVDVVVQDAVAIGAFEFELAFDLIWLDFTGWSLGPFLGSTGRVVTCHQILTENTIRIGCTTTGAGPPDGPSGSGVLVTLRFRPKFGGRTCLPMLLVETATVLGDPLPTSGQSACVTINPDTPTPTTTGVPTSTDTPTSTHTPVTPTSTHTPVTPTSTRTPLTPTSTRTPVTPTPSSTPGTPGTSTPVDMSTTPTATPTPARCAYDRDHWRDHPDEWPTDRLHIGHDDYSKDELLKLLKADPSDDPSVALAQELIAAKLNAAAGLAWPPADVVALGDTLLSEAGDKLPLHQSRSDYRGQGMLWVAASLAHLERDDDCEVEDHPATRSPTAVNTVLSSTRRNLPSGLPGTGQRTPFGSDSRGRIIAVASIVIGSVLLVLVRRTIAGRKPGE